jgi:hypothetical protein
VNHLIAIINQNVKLYRTWRLRLSCCKQILRYENLSYQRIKFIGYSHIKSILTRCVMSLKSSAPRLRNRLYNLTCKLFSMIQSFFLFRRIRSNIALTQIEKEDKLLFGLHDKYLNYVIFLNMLLCTINYKQTRLLDVG